jgi:hypothetical protein
MEEQAHFKYALACVGFSPIKCQGFIEASGCINIVMLGLLSPEQVSRIFKRLVTRAANPIPTSAIQEQLMLSIRVWVAGQQRLQQPIDAGTVTAAMALNQAQQMRQALEDDAREKESLAKLPDKFKVATQWKIFAEAIETYLSQILGSGRVPLSYVIHQMVLAPMEQAYDTEQARMIALAPLNGISYQQDNARVYGIIKQLVLEAPSHTYILRFDGTANGRSAWLALHDNYEGNGFRNQNVNDAYSLLDGP